MKDCTLCISYITVVILFTFTATVLLFLKTGVTGPTEIKLVGLPAKHNNSSDDDFMSHSSMRYALYGEANNSQVGSHNSSSLLRYIRSQISRPAQGDATRLSGEYPLNKDFSQFGQSTVVDGLLKGRRSGFYVECGADAGEALSNTLFFERARNWTGLLVEPNSNSHRRLLAVNRNAFVLGACLSTSEAPGATTLHIAGVLGGSLKHMAKPQLRHVMNAPLVQVQCFPLNSVLAALNRNHVDYFSLDVEGAELAILKTVDWSRLKVDIFTIEYQVFGEYGSTQPKEGLKKLAALRRYFASTGLYEEIGLIPQDKRKPASEITAIDVIFARKDLLR